MRCAITTSTVAEAPTIYDAAMTGMSTPNAALTLVLLFVAAARLRGSMDWASPSPWIYLVLIVAALATTVGVFVLHERRRRTARVAAAEPGLLPVSLHDARVAGVGVVGVLTGAAARPSLAQQVPALVELHAEPVEPLLLLVS